MRVVLLGCTRISLESFRTLLRMEIDVVGVLTTPREFKISYATSPVVAVQHADLVTAAERAGVPVILVTGKMGEYTKAIGKLRPDFLLAVGWYYVIPSAIRTIAPLGCAGVHASLLPKSRGGAPLNWALINGEERTGVTLFYLADGVDDGDIIAQATIPIAFDDTCAMLYDKVTAETQILLERYLPLIERGCAPRVPQDEREATWFPQRRPEDGMISWSLTTRQIYNWVRALTRPYPGAFTFLDGQCFQVWKASMLDARGDSPGGTILSVVPGASIDVATVDGSLRLFELSNCPWELVHPGRRFSGEA